MDSGSRTAHGDPRPARTPSREQLVFVFFSRLLMRQFLLTTYWYVTGFCSVAVVPVDYIRHWIL